MEHHRQVHHINKSRTFKRFGSIIAVGLLSAGLAGLPSITGADGGNGNGGNGGNGNGNSNAAGSNGNSNAAGSNGNGNGNGAADKAVICHIPPGNPDNSHTIQVGEPAVAAHLAHGDTLEACGTATTTTEATTTTTTTEAPTTTSTTSTTTTSTTSTTTTSTIPFNPAVAVSFTPTGDPSFCNIVGSMTGFLPNTSYDMVFTLTVGSHPDNPWTFNVTTDGTGSATLVAFSYNQVIANVFVVSVDALASTPADVDC